MIDADMSGSTSDGSQDVPDEERVANAAASEFCVPQEKMLSFIARKNPFFYEKDVPSFCENQWDTPRPPCRSDTA